MNEDNSSELAVTAKKQMVGDGPNEILFDRLRKANAVVNAELVIKSKAAEEESRRKKYRDNLDRYNILIRRLGAELCGVHSAAIDCLEPEVRKILEEKVLALAKKRSRLHKFLAAACGIAYVALPAGLDLAGYFKETSEGFGIFLAFWFMFGWISSLCLYFSDHSKLAKAHRYLLEHYDDAPKADASKEVD